MVKNLLKDERSINKEKILKAAVEVFLKNGYQRTTIREISTKSKLSTGTIYFYFKNKEEILKEVINKIELISTGAFPEKIDEINPVELLKNINLELTGVMAKNYEMLLLLINASSNIPKLNSFFYEQFKDRTQTLTEMFKQLIKKGVIREVNPEKAAIFTLSNSLSMVILKEGFLKKNLENTYYEEMHKFILDIFANGFFVKK